MPELSQVSVAEVMRVLPELVPLEQGLVGETCVDLLIVCAGFEERATAIVDDLREIDVQHVITIVYPTNVADNDPARTKLGELAVNRTRLDIPYDRFDFVRQLQESVKSHQRSEGIRIIVDISGMASYVVYRVLSAVWKTLPLAKLAVYYAEASDYSPTESEWKGFFASVSDPADNLAMAECYEQTHFQSKGVEVTYDSDVFPGQNAGPLATEVIAVPSFSLLRMKAMLAHAGSHYSTSKEDVRWFLGQPPDRVKNGWRYDALASLYNVRNRGEAVSTRDYREMFQKLDVLWEEVFTERHLVIASLGSKMQHLGTFLFLMMHPECGQVLCEPSEFIASRYTRGVGPTWWVDFGKIGSVHDVLVRRGNIEFRW